MLSQTTPSALFIDLSEEQQEFVTGGTSGEPQTFNYTETQYSQKNPEDPEGETKHLQGATGDPSVLNNFFFLRPLLFDLIRLEGGGDLL